MNSMLRRIEQRNARGELTGTFTTDLSDEELAARDREQAERRNAVLSANLSAVTAERDAARAEEDALAGVGVDDHAQDHLRAAHTALAEARAELGRRREIVTAAEAHVGRCEAAAAAAKRTLDGMAERAAAALVEQLEQGQAPRAPTPTRAAAEKAETARVELEHAIAAKAEVDGLAARAARAVIESETHLKEAARSVIRGWIYAVRCEIDTLNAELAARKDRLHTLMPCLYEPRWPTPWPAEAEALLSDPEAVLDAAGREEAASAA